MRAVDTDIVVRYLANDDPAQAKRVRRLVELEDLFLPLTVLLESEWVLRSMFAVPAMNVITALRAFAGLPRVTIENPSAVAQAFEWASKGMDFADALHLAAAQPLDGFVSFDKALARAARRLGGPVVSSP